MNTHTCACNDNEHWGFKFEGECVWGKGGLEERKKKNTLIML